MHPAMLVTLFILGVFIIAQASITLKMIQAQSAPDKNAYNFSMLMLFSGIAMVLMSSIWLALKMKGGSKNAAAAVGGAASAAAGSLTAPPAPAAAAVQPNQLAALAQLLKTK